MSGFGTKQDGEKNSYQLKNQIVGKTLLNNAIYHHTQVDLKNAEKAYRRAINIGILDAKLFSNLGVICQKSQRIEEAILLYEKAIEVSPSDPNPYTNLGNLYQELGQLDQALASTLKSLELKPHNPDALMNLGGIYKVLGQLDQALAATLKSIELKPDNPYALPNLGGIYQELGQLDQALAVTLKSLELNPENSIAYMNLGGIYKDLGNLDQALASTFKSLELNPDNCMAHINLGGIYKDLGNLDQALASTLKSLEFKPQDSKALCQLGLIKMALGQMTESRRHLLIAIKCNNHECQAYYALSLMLETAEDAEEILDLLKLVELSVLPPRKRLYAEFAFSNCFHKIKNYGLASKYLQFANNNKLIMFPSNVNILMQNIELSTSSLDPDEVANIDTISGERRIFIVGMPRSGSTLLETVLSMNPAIKDLGESTSLSKAISYFQHQLSNAEPKTLYELYSTMEPIDSSQYKYSTDKQLYNFVHTRFILSHLPAAMIIHCRRNPMDNILSMYRSNLMAGNNYTASLEDAARVLIAQEQVMEFHKKRCPNSIFTFDYDQFVNATEVSLRKLLRWLDLEFDYNYLHPEKSTRCVNTASVMQARRSISNASVGGWEKYYDLLKPALKIFQDSGIEV